MRPPATLAPSLIGLVSAVRISQKPILDSSTGSISRFRTHPGPAELALQRGVTLDLRASGHMSPQPTRSRHVGRRPVSPASLWQRICHVTSEFRPGTACYHTPRARVGWFRSAVMPRNRSSPQIKS